MLSLLAPASALAADLGRLTALSGVGEPLRAEIEIMGVGPGEVQSLRARIPPPEVFWRANLEPPPNLSALRASVEPRPGRRYVVALRSITPIDNPFVQILVELESPTGVVVREYPFLLDDRPVQAAGPPAATLPRMDVPNADERSAWARDAATARPRAAPSAEGTYVVRPGDTLASIARDTTPAGATLEQAIVALHRANPEAFDHGNMNRLRAGATLSMPPPQAVHEIGRSEALQAIRAQQASQGTEPRRTAGGRSGGDRLQLTRSEDREAGDPRSDAAGGDEIAALQRALAEAQERISLLEKSLQDFRSLLVLRDRPTAAPNPAVVAAAGVSYPKSDFHRFLDAYGGWLLSAFTAAYLSWIVMPLKTARVWRAHRRQRARASATVLVENTRRRRRR